MQGRPRAARAALAVLLLAAAALAGGCATPEQPESFAVRIAYQAVPADGVAPTAADMETIRTIIESRLGATGIAALRVTVSEPDVVIVEASPASVVNVVRRLAGVAGRVDFVPLGQQALEAGQTVDLHASPPLFSGDQVASAAIGSDQTGMRTVDFVLEDKGRQILADHSSAHVGDHFAITLDGRVLTAPVINGPILGGEVQISGGGGGFTLEEAQELVTILRFGRLPFPLREVAAPG